ncbi:high mobility group box domain-containing protein, partial [Ephemerocybe angulata]
IARPPNAFIIFRSDFWAAEKLKPQPVERNNADISRIVGHCWNSMDAAQKKVYYDRAAQLREMHRLRYPDYRLKPAARRPRAQKLKSGVVIEKEERCRRLASAIIGEAHQLDFNSPS